MADSSSRAKVAIPRIPPWTAPTPAAVAKAAEAQKRREEGKAKDGAAAKAVVDGVAASAGAAAVVNGNGEIGGNGVSVAALEGLVDSRIRVTNSLGRAIAGMVYSCSASELVLSTGATEYHIIPVSKIRSYEVLGKEGHAEQAATTRERESTKQRQVAEEREKKLVKPPGVSAVGHALFLVLEKTLPVRWNDKTIVVLENVTIDPPYDADDCKAPAKHTKQLERVRHLVRREREKVAGRRGG